MKTVLYVVEKKIGLVCWQLLHDVHATETQRRCHQKSKTGVSVTSQLMSSKN